MNIAKKYNYLNPDVPERLPLVKTPLVVASNESLAGYGFMADSPDFPVELVTWPKPTGRPVDAGTGNQAGIKKGVFEFWWDGDLFFGKNNAVNDEYLLGWGTQPELAKRGIIPDLTHRSVLLWHANYHPDGGQLFYPLDPIPFVVPLALPGDDIRPDKFVNFWFDGKYGLYIHPNVWHEGVFSAAPNARFLDVQGSVHARVSCDIAAEFGVFLEVELKR